MAINYKTINKAILKWGKALRSINAVKMKDAQ